MNNCKPFSTVVGTGQIQETVKKTQNINLVF